MGIMNGTTNFMLCKMEDEGAEYGSALQEAQRLGKDIMCIVVYSSV
jgi:homoserine dehydrogenase